jgi:glycosyltransferase involved in cell wall biosynthesis
LRVSVIIPHLNDMEGLQRTLAGLAAQTRLPDEVIVADNGSDAGMAAIVATADAFPALAVQVIPAQARGAGPARNAGAAIARGDMLAFLDCDCLPAPDWIARGAALAGGIVGGPVTVFWDGPPNAVAAFDLLFGFDVAASFRRHRHLLTANLWVSREVFALVGPFRTRVSEDVEWCWRADALQQRLRFDPHLAVGHRALDSYGALHRRWRRITRETHALHQERGRSRVRWCVTLGAILLSIPVHGLRVLFTRRISGLGLRLETLAVLASIRLDRVRCGLEEMACSGSDRGGQGIGH